MGTERRNRPQFAELSTMPVGGIARLPAEHLALLQEEADQALNAAKQLKDWLDGAKFSPGLHRAERQADFPSDARARGIAMSNSTRIAALRKRHYAFKALPDTIVLPALEGRRPESAVKALEDATLEDIAFALRALEAGFNMVGNRLHALRRLYVMAPELGALGCERPLDLLADGGR